MSEKRRLKPKKVAYKKLFFVIEKLYHFDNQNKKFRARIYFLVCRFVHSQAVKVSFFNKTGAILQLFDTL